MTVEQRSILKEKLEKLERIKKLMIAVKKLKYSNGNLLIVGVFLDIQRLDKSDLQDVWTEVFSIFNELGKKYIIFDLKNNNDLVKRFSLVDNSILYENKS